MDHLQYMCVRSNQDTSAEPVISGHAMMWSGPPFSHVDKHPDVQYPLRMPEMSNKALMKLLTLSQDLPLDGEITPVIALNLIRKHPRFKELTANDFVRIKNDLEKKTRCYGYEDGVSAWSGRDADTTQIWCCARRFRTARCVEPGFCHETRELQHAAMKTTCVSLECMFY
jgi:hypothetical protein